MRPTEAKSVFVVRKVDWGGSLFIEIYATEHQANLACEGYQGAYAGVHETPVLRKANELKRLK